MDFLDTHQLLSRQPTLAIYASRKLRATNPGMPSAAQDLVVVRRAPFDYKPDLLIGRGILPGGHAHMRILHFTKRINGYHFYYGV